MVLEIVEFPRTLSGKNLNSSKTYFVSQLYHTFGYSGCLHHDKLVIIPLSFIISHSFFRQTLSRYEEKPPKSKLRYICDPTWLVISEVRH